jgi:nucleotide-binding universal stress UspA family protein
MPAAGDPSAQQTRAERISAREIAAVTTETGSSRPLASRVIEGPAAAVLVEASRTARMLVLGSHGHHRLYQTVLGSTSAACVREAICPVVIVPAVRQAPVPVS